MIRRIVLCWSLALFLAACSLDRSPDSTPVQTGEAWQAHAPMPTPRSEMAAAVLDGRIYVPGGFGGETAFEAYDPQADAWEALAPLPAGRHHLMTAAHAGRVYVFGGSSARPNWTPTSTAWSYDPSEDEWNTLTSMPEARMSGAAVSLGDFIYVVGGTGGSNALLRYDPAEDTWSSLAPLSQPREHTAAAVLDGEIYALAGRWEVSGELASVEVYDPQADRWDPASPLANARGGFAAVSLDDRIVVMGGEVLAGARETLASVEVFDPVQGQWLPGPDLPVPLHGVPAVNFDGRVYVIGGSDRAGGIDNHGRVLSIGIESIRAEGSTPGAPSVETSPPTSDPVQPSGNLPDPAVPSPGVDPPAGGPLSSLYLPLLSNGNSAPDSASAPAFDSINASPWVEQVLAAMSLEQKIGQMLLIGVEGAEVTPELCESLKNIAPGGIIYRRENTSDPEQVRQLSQGLQGCAEAAGTLPLLITLDHEGQYVTRFSTGVSTFPAALALGAVGDPSLAQTAALASGQELAYSGVNMVLGPVADVLMNYENAVVSQRVFGGDPLQVSLFVEQAVTGYQQAGLIPVLKHFPGHGGVAEDSHELLPVDQADRQTLERAYLPPFRSGLAAGAPVVMPAHVAFPQVSGSDQPATLSPEIISLLRQDLQFEGVILSDSMNMKGATGGVIPVDKASLWAVQAGVDMILNTNPALAQGTYERLLQAAQKGDLGLDRIDAAVSRILTLKENYGLTAFPLPEREAPDWEANAQLAFESGRRAVALYHDQGEVIPIPAALNRILVVGPSTDWEFYPVLEAGLAGRGHTVEMVYYPPPWEGPVNDAEALESLPARAAEFDLVLVFTWQVHLNRLTFEDTWQIELVERLTGAGRPVIVAALKSPTDLLSLPPVSAYIAMFGTTPGQNQALLDILTGTWQPAGQNPLPELVK